MKADIWKSKNLGKRYLKIMRAAIPLAKVRAEVLLVMISKTRKDVSSFLDLGCGDGVLGWTVLSKYPKARGVFLDFSETMIDAARKKAPKKNRNLFFVEEDYGKSGWSRSVARFGKFDLIVSGFSIHCQTDRKKKEIYRRIFGLLRPGGLFLNMEHVASPTNHLKKVFEEYFVDSLYGRLRCLDKTLTRKKVSEKYYYNRLKAPNILVPVGKQCRWLREIGFSDVDCYFKILELALFGGIKAR